MSNNPYYGQVFFNEQDLADILDRTDVHSKLVNFLDFPFSTHEFSF